MFGLLLTFWTNLKRKGRVAQFTILVSFLLTFLTIRAITHLQRLNLLPNQQGSLHIHHLVPGIFLLLTSGYVGLSFWNNSRLRHLMATFFGIGAALTVDEFALWLFLKDVYWAKQGRDSVDAVIIFIILFSIGYLISAAHDHQVHLLIIKKLFPKL